MDVNEDLVETLEDMLADAKVGKVQNLLCLYDDGRDIDFHVILPSDGLTLKILLGALNKVASETYPELVTN